MKILLLALLLPLFARSQNTIYTTDIAGKLKVVLVGIPGGNTIANTTSETAFAEPQPVLPPSMWFIGRVFHLDVAGTFGTALAVPSFTGKVKLNSTVIGTTGSIALVGSLSAKQWTGSLDITVCTVGSSGAIEVQGVIRIQTGLGTVELPIVNTSTITIDMTTSQTLTLTSTWSAASTSSTITLRQFCLQ